MSFRDRIVRSANAAFVSLIVEEICIPSVLHNFLNSPANFVPLSTQFFSRRFFFLIIVKYARTVSLESFLSLCIYSSIKQTLDELEDTLHRYYLSLVYQRMPSPYTKFHF